MTETSFPYLRPGFAAGEPVHRPFRVKLRSLKECRFWYSRPKSLQEEAMATNGRLVS